MPQQNVNCAGQPNSQGQGPDAGHRDLVRPVRNEIDPGVSKFRRLKTSSSSCRAQLAEYYVTLLGTGEGGAVSATAALRED